MTVARSVLRYVQRDSMKKSKAPEAHEDISNDKAKAIDSPAGKIAPVKGVAEPAPVHRHSTKPAKLQKKNKPHLPRKMKKAQKKAAAKAQA